MNQPDNVRSLNVRPKQRTELYRKVRITISYSPSTKEWKWKFDISHTVHYGGTKPSFDEALKAAKHQIDIVQGRGPGPGPNTGSAT